MATVQTLPRQHAAATSRYMKNAHPIAVRLDQDLKDAIEARAAEEDQSLSWLINSDLRKVYGLANSPAQKRGKPSCP